MMQLLEKMTVNPAKLYNFDCGTLKEGAAADIVILHRMKSNSRIFRVKSGKFSVSWCTVIWKSKIYDL